MGLLKTLLTAPVKGPVKGFTWVAGKLAEKVEAEVFDPKKIQQEMEDLQLAYDLGKITEEELEEGETLLLERLKAIRES
ncbi:gas vesicle protein GvpG [Eilatimonas milleporae]|uniref:Gas vesicle protein GvpG n=1 Tax=Eilatimonas milleporae TaxID=911205 RepID=A0A3M0CXN5_9PROT|nr:gas vesicle protein GvpG [Eilatimonas milleporae]RMB12379.1 gas vesicle protein GvpG [Eilatimonas milleporae]